LIKDKCNIVAVISRNASRVCSLFLKIITGKGESLIGNYEGTMYIFEETVEQLFVAFYM